MRGMSINTEIVVIGSGPGGAAAAWYLASFGHEVTLIDRSAFPRDKTCGDGLTPMAVQTLHHMGILEGVMASGATRLDQARLTGPLGMQVAVRFEEFVEHQFRYALVLPRLVLDETLHRHALAAGARNVQAAVKHIERSDDRVTAILADGPEGPLSIEARQVVISVGANLALLQKNGFLTRRPRLVRAARQYYEGVEMEPSYDFYFDLHLLPGYGWIFPTGGGKANIGAGIYPAFYATRKPARTLVEEFVARRQRQGVLRDARPSAAIKGFPLRVDFAAERTAGKNWVLIGEAAGLVNPVTGEGIDLALESGLLAAQIIRENIAAGRPNHRAYASAIWSRFGPLFNGLNSIRDMLVNPLLLDYVLWLMGQHRFLARMILGIAQGVQGPQNLFHPLVLLQLLLPISPRYLWGELQRGRALSKRLSA